MATIDFAQRLKQLPPYLFVEIDAAKRKAVSEGRDIIDVGVGDPDTGTPAFIIEALKKAADDKKNHKYAFDAGLPLLRTTIANWFIRRFGVEFNADTEIYPLIGSKEGIAHLPLSVVNPGETVLVPEPCYPPYVSGSIFAGAKIVRLPLLEKNRFLPSLSDITDARLLFINYPNNPTAATVDKAFLTELVALARKKGIIIAADAAYSEMYYDNQKPLSIFEIEGARDIAIEFHSLSKTYNMTGWRIGWACGNAKIVSALAKLKTNVDSGVFQAIQLAAVTALGDGDAFPSSMRAMYQARRDCLVDGLRELGWQIEKPKATFYVWAKIPSRFKGSMEFAKLLLDRADIIATPGIGFGAAGEGYIRMTLTVDENRLRQALTRIKTKGILTA